jgi:hypothetical protein
VFGLLKWFATLIPVFWLFFSTGHSFSFCLWQRLIILRTLPLFLSIYFVKSGSSFENEIKKRFLKSLIVFKEVPIRTIY